MNGQLISGFFLYYEDWIISSLKLELKIFKILFQGFQYYTQIWVYFRSLIVDFPRIWVYHFKERDCALGYP